MKRILLSGAILVAVGAFLVLELGASSGQSALGTYKIELDNAFGLVNGADFKVAGVRAGSISNISLDQKTLHAVVTVQVTQPGFGQFRSDAFCQSRPQSLIGEYFVDCQPGQNGKALKPGSTIPVTQTQSTIPADLLVDIMRMPYRQRFSLIFNELGAAVASRSEDLQSALARAVPALTETDNLLNLLSSDSTTIQNLTRDSNSVITALANNSSGVQRFIVAANNTATDTATQSANLQASLQKLPGFLEELRPTLAQLSAATAANTPVLANLNSAAGQLNRLFTDIPPFSHSALPALKSLGHASVTGKAAVQAANPTIAHLNQFAKPTPELAQNLSIVLSDLDNRSKATERDPRSPAGGAGYTGLEALLQYVFNQALAINTYGPWGHMLAVDGFLDAKCSPYATPATIATNLKNFGPSYRSCYSWLGPNQIGVNQPDPSNPGACVPDPGGAPPGHTAQPTSACKLTAADAASGSKNVHSASSKAGPGSALAGSGSTATAAGGSTSSGSGPATPTGSGASASSTGGGSSSGPGASLGQTLNQLLGSLGLGGSSSSSTASGTATSSSGSSAGNQAQQLLSYLLAP